MGCCVSKKKQEEVVASPTPTSSSQNIKTQIHNNPPAPAPPAQEGSNKKEIFVIKHRKSHDNDTTTTSTPAQTNSIHASSSGEETATADHHPIVRTSSCTKEEVDAILIQCGRLSRSNSSGKTPSSARKYSGSKRSYDFDNDAPTPDLRPQTACDDDEDAAGRRQNRHRNRPSSRSSSHERRRRRTPSAERDQQRSGSKERSSSSNGRRVSRSPGKRSDQQQPTPNPPNRPGKMVSVPATVAMDKTNNCGETNTVKRISVRRNVGAAAASPRSQSPARGAQAAVAQQPSLSRSSSRKAEQSPYRRNPLSEIDPNTLSYPHSAPAPAPTKGLKDAINQTATQKQHIESGGNMKAGNFSAVDNNNYTSKEEAQPLMAANVTITRVAESLRPQTVTRSRSSRLSRDLDINPETLTNNPSYTALLLEDIQNFHQKNSITGPTTTTQPAFSLPACVSKACSILEAVADLNSTTSSTAFSEKGHHQAPQQSNNNYKDPFVESEVAARDDLMEPSLHKYVTVTRGGGGGDMKELEEEEEEEESSGSNSFVGGSVGGHHWGALHSSSWEPNSGDSTDRWTATSSRSNTREYSSEFGRKTVSETRRVIGSKPVLHTTPLAAVGGAAASM